MAEASGGGAKVDYGRAFNRLTHVVALSREGKIEAVIGDLALTTLAIDDSLGSKSAEEICAAIDAYFGVELPGKDIDDALNELLRRGKIVADPRTGRRVLQPHEQSAIMQRISAASELEATVKAEWLQGLGRPDGDTVVDGEQLWRCLRAYLAKVLARHGAESILLLDPNAPTSESRASLSSLQAAALRECGVGADSQVAKDAIGNFITTATAARTRYVAQLLDGTFSFFALSADAATEEYLTRALPSLSIFLDTNFIFGLLELHENPLDSVSKELVDFIGSQRFPFRVYYHERTLEELRRTLGHIAERLKGVRWTASLSRAALRAGTLSSIELKFHEIYAKSHVDVEVFLERYETHIPELLESRGFKIYREPDGGPTVEERGRLAAEYADFVKKSRREEKPYPTVDHDMSVWLSLQRRRTSGRSVLESGAVFLSNDFLLYRFDRFHLTKPGGVQTVVMPGPLLQVLRPFGRSGEDFDRRFVATFAIPEFRTLHTDYAATSSRVLSYLATYADLPEEMAVKILTNEVLIDRLQRIDARSPEFKEVIESQMVKENAALATEIADIRAETARREATQTADLERATKEAAEARQAADALRAELVESKSRSLSREVDDGRPSGDAEQAKRAVPPADAAEMSMLRRRIRIVLAISVAVIGLMGVFALPPALAWDWLLEHRNRLSLQVGALVIVGGLAWAVGDDHPLRRWVAVGAVVVGMLVGLVPLLS